MSICAAAWIALAALMLCGQSSREPYRSAYRSWREADPSLERDAATSGAPKGARADRVAAEAVKYWGARRAFLDRFARESEEKLAWLETPVEVAPALSAGAGDYISAQTAGVRRGIVTFAKDSDPGIQQVRTMLERENVALSTLNTAVAARQKAAGEADRAAGAMEAARLNALDLNRALAAGIKQAREEAGAEEPAWAEYYRKLSDGVRNIPTTDVGRAILSPAGTPVSAIASRPADSAERPAPSMPPLPLVRYTGDWIFAPNGMSHGAQPESVDLTVRETNGRCEGKMIARFILPPGSAGDPVMRFDFAGEFKSTPRQTFPLETGDGAKGTIDLIPGTAFNLLEINVQIAAKPGKVSRANVVLIKK